MAKVLFLSKHKFGRKSTSVSVTKLLITQQSFFLIIRTKSQGLSSVQNWSCWSPMKILLWSLFQVEHLNKRIRLVLFRWFLVPTSWLMLSRLRHQTMPSCSSDFPTGGLSRLTAQTKNNAANCFQSTTLLAMPAREFHRASEVWYRPYLLITSIRIQQRSFRTLSIKRTRMETCCRSTSRQTTSSLPRLTSSQLIQ